jgi:hypothetical protein
VILLVPVQGADQVERDPENQKAAQAIAKRD